MTKHQPTDALLSRQHLAKVYKQLSAPFEDEAVERTKGAQTRKGYDTTGIKYQFIVDRLNKVLGPGCFRTTQEMAVTEMTRQSGRTAFSVDVEITLQLGNWGMHGFNPVAEVFGIGGHTSNSLADAKKGAYTNGFKKAAAMLGVGRQAYAGTIDDDNQPIPEEFEYTESRDTYPPKKPNGNTATKDFF